MFGSSAFTLTVSGIGFTPASTVQWNGAARTTTFVNANSLKAAITAADVASVGTASITVSTPAPGGGTSPAVIFNVSPYPVPNIITITPNAAVVNSADTVVSVSGSGFVPGSSVQISGTPVTTSYDTYFGNLQFTIPAAYLTTVQTYAITVSNPTPGGGISSPVSFNVVPYPQPVLNGISPNTAPVGGPSVTLTVNGSGFSPNSVVRWNGSDRATTYLGPSQLTATLPSSDFTVLGNASVSVFNGAPGGGTSSTQAFTTYLPLPANDLVYSSSTQMLYSSVPSNVGSTLGNSIVPIDPVTGNLGTPIWVGSEPGRMAVSSDGNTLYVGLTGAAAVRRVNLATGTAGLQFSLGGGNGTYNTPNSPVDLAILPGSPGTVAVGFSNGTWWDGGITVFDSGVARPNTANTAGGIGLTSVSGLAFDPSGATIYAAGQGYSVFPVNSFGLGSATVTTSQVSADLRLDSGRVYLTNGAVLDAASGNQLGIFASAPNTPANGSVAPDSSLGKAFILLNSFFFNGTNQINIYDLNSFIPLGNIPLGAVGQSNPGGPPPRLIRWGQNGLAFSTGAQIYILRSNLVADLSSTSADLAVSVSAPSGATTGSSVLLTYTVTNNGSGVANPVSFTDQMPAGVSVQSVQVSVGSCAGMSMIRCDLGSLAAQTSATIKITLTPLTAATLQDAAQVSAPQADPNLGNNAAAANIMVTGSDYNAVPAIASVSPPLVAEGATGITLTVNGYGFDASSVIEWNGVALPTTFLSSNQLSAPVDPAQLGSMGWAWVNVISATPV